MEIKQNLISTDKYPIKAPYIMQPKGICVHNTANDASAKNEITYTKRNNNKVSYHIAVDDIEAIQAIPFGRTAWHAGDGKKGEGNRNYIGIEICYSKSGGDKFQKAEQNTAKVIAKLCKQFRFSISDVKKHQDFSGKYCPHRTLDIGWGRFLKMVEVELNSNVKLQDRKDVERFPLLKVDGYWGPATTRALQRYFHTPEDGVISKPSMVIKAIQGRVGAKQDGYRGPETIRKMQKHFGTPQDGVISLPSMMVKEMQRQLNQGKF